MRPSFFDLLIAIVFDFLIIALGGLAFSWNWEWFVVPTFRTHSLAVPVSMGLLLIARTATNQYIPAPKDTQDSKAMREAVYENALLPVLCLLYGWVIHMFLV